MNKRNLKKSVETPHQFLGHKSYSIAEILAAGGATAFANKMGKSPETIGDHLKNLPVDAFLTEEEATQALETLNRGK